jgi:deoxyribonuclease V
LKDYLKEVEYSLLRGKMHTVNAKPNFSVEKAHKIQLLLSKKIIFEDKLPKKIDLVAGVDVAYAKGVSIGAVAVLDYDSLELVESQTASCETRFPYIPTLLSFREVPPAVLAIQRLHLQPDVFLVDGHGFAHPYRCGFASHLGLAIRKPTIGVAKGLLFGKRGNFEVEKGIVLLKDDDTTIGAMITMGSEFKPAYVSVGHMVSLKTAIEIVKHCMHGKRIPEPIRKAHEAANIEKRKFNIL